MRKIWTKAEDVILKKHYPHKRTQDIIKFFSGRSLAAIRSHAAWIGVKKTEAFLKSSESGRTLGQHSTAGQFKKNGAGWNKGMKAEQYMSAESLAKIRSCGFKKGRDPHNIAPIGSENMRGDGYMEIKVRHTKMKYKENFRFKHHVEFEKHFGPIPKGMLVAMKDGNKLNYSPDNLVLITRKENMNKNGVCDATIIKKYLGIKDSESIEKIVAELPQIIELKRSAILLNRKLNKTN
jgi:hypothetical protein